LKVKAAGGPSTHLRIATILRPHVIGLDLNTILLSKGMSNMSIFGQSNKSSTGAGGVLQQKEEQEEQQVLQQEEEEAWDAFDAACDAVGGHAGEISAVIRPNLLLFSLCVLSLVQYVRLV
jgi:hypothetical protein